jgi:hypothetical protein
MFERDADAGAIVGNSHASKAPVYEADRRLAVYRTIEALARVNRLGEWGRHQRRWARMGRSEPLAMVREGCRDVIEPRRSPVIEATKRFVAPGGTKLKFPTSMIRPNVVMPMQMAMPRCSGIAKASTRGRVSLGQTRTM